VSIGKDKKATRLCAHEFHCHKLKELMSKKEKTSKKGDQKPEAFTLMEWIKDKSEEERKSKAHLAWTLAAVMSNLSTAFLTSSYFLSAAEVTRSLTSPLAYKREDWKASLLEMKSEVVTQIRRQLRGNPVCLIFDGWRIRYRQEHAHGFLVADWNGLVYFHSLIADLEEHSSEYIFDAAQRVSKEVEEAYGVVVTSVVADNAFVMCKALKMIETEFPAVAHACAAHWIQLTLRDVSSAQYISDAMGIAKQIRSMFNTKESVKILRNACVLKKSKTKSMRAPVETRWSSEVYSMVSILKIRDGIQLAASTMETTIEDWCFELLYDVASVLVELVVATNAVQADSAGLMKQEHTLLRLCTSLHELAGEENDRVRDIANIVIEALESRRMHHSSTEHDGVCACLVLCVKPSVLDPSVVERGTNFILSRGPSFIRKLIPEYSESDTEEIKSALEIELGTHFEENQGCNGVECIDMVKAVREWKLQLHSRKKLLAKLAQVLFAVRSSEAAAERSFSHASLRLTPQRNRISVELLELETFVRMNANFMEESWKKRGSVSLSLPKRKRRVVVEHEHPLGDKDDPEICEEEEYIPTRCLPATKPILHEDNFEHETENGPLDRLTALDSCEECGTPVSDDRSDWWRCSKCLLLFCPSCSDFSLDDASGLCSKCDPEVVFLSQKRQRESTIRHAFIDGHAQ